MACYQWRRCCASHASVSGRNVR